MSNADKTVSESNTYTSLDSKSSYKECNVRKRET